MLRADFCDRVAVVTGASSGIGAAVAAGLVANGAAVVGWDLAAPPDPGGAAHRTVDVRDPAAITGATDAVMEAHGRIDLLVCSAGAARRGSALEGTVDDWDLVLEVNLRGAFLASRACAAHMPAGGSIVQVASVMGLSGGLYPNASYQASKGGLVNLTRALAIEWAGRGIRVNAVAPGWTDTPFIEALKADPTKMATLRERTPMGVLVEPEDVADAVLFLLSGHARLVTGHVLAVDGGFLAQ
jgi:NAD(P)-dependent dehydrogenase (short-subunit alcohol dehydrogenase family)